jgi:hypothetical protein
VDMAIVWHRLSIAGYDEVVDVANSTDIHGDQLALDDNQYYTLLTSW